MQYSKCVNNFLIKKLNVDDRELAFTFFQRLPVVSEAHAKDMVAEKIPFKKCHEFFLFLELRKFSSRGAHASSIE